MKTRNRKPLKGWRTAVIVALLFSISSIGAENKIVVPNSLANTQGNSGDNFPFLGDFRSQQVYASSQFSTISEGGGWINTISFQPDPRQLGGFIAGISNLQINLSTTAKVPDGLSSTFAQNVGPDDTVVFGPAAIALSGDYFPGRFDVRIPLTTPFFYNPGNGNLLMDIRNYSGDFWQGQGGYLDGELTMGDSVSRLWGGVNLPSAILVDTFGFVTQFGVTPVPEPSSFVLFGLGAIGVGACLRRRRNKGGQP